MTETFNPLLNNIMMVLLGFLFSLFVMAASKRFRSRIAGAAEQRKLAHSSVIDIVLEESLALQRELEDLIHEGDRLATENRELRRELRELKSKARRELAEELTAPLTSDDARALLEQVIAARKNRGDPQ